MACRHDPKPGCGSRLWAGNPPWATVRPSATAATGAWRRRAALRVS